MMGSVSGIVADFSQDVRNFAFQINISQKNVVDIYPLDSGNDYSVNSSLVSHIDYEGNELKTSDIIFSGWCAVSNKEGSKKSKRKHDDESDNTSSIANIENFYVNGFSTGKLVFFSSGGKQIVNIIQLKRELKMADTVGSDVWILDSENTVKKFQHNQSKPLKTLQLTDINELSNQEVISFHALKKGFKTILAIGSQNHIYLIDPNKKNPAVVGKYEIANCLKIVISEDEKYVVGATDCQIIVFEIVSGSPIRKWDEKVSKLKIIDNYIVSLNQEGYVSVYKLEKEESICKIFANEAEIIEFTSFSNSVIIAWLNVNEPNFKAVSFQELSENHKIILDSEVENTELKTMRNNIMKENVTGEDEINYGISPQKVSKAEQDELTQSLISALNSSDDNEQIKTIMLLETWSEQRIKSFVIEHIFEEVATRKILEVTISNLLENVWDKSTSMGIWLKWIITLRGDSTLSKEFRKQLKHLKSNLRFSVETLPTLLGIQGKLDMLRKQVQIRDELASFNITGDNLDTENIEQGEAVDEIEGNAIDSDIADSIAYANGEGETFVDASEYRDQVHFST